MDLTDILAGENAYVKAKEAEALEIFGQHAGPAVKTLHRLRRKFGHVLPITVLGRFASPAEGELFTDGKRKATRILFDAYAETVFRRVRDPEDFIVLLGAIEEKVATKLTFPCSEPPGAELTLIDWHEAELCRLAWVRTAWERAKPTAIRVLWQRLLTLLSGGASRNGRSIAEPVAAENTSAPPTVMPDASPHGASVEPAERAAPAPPTTTANGENGMDPRAVIDAFIGKLAEAGHKITKKDIWTVAGYGDPTEFERFQRGDARATRSAAAAFNRVLNMESMVFIQLLEKKSAPK